MKYLERGRIYKHKVQEAWTKDMISNNLKNEVFNQKIKELASCNNSMQREIIENAYKELEKEKMQRMAHLQESIQSDDKKNLEDKIQKLKTALEYFDEIINASKLNRIILQMILYIER